MTNEELAEYYAKLLILQYVGKPKAFATIKQTALPFIMDQLPTQVQDAFNINTAIGVQLDVLGKYAGVTRTGYDLNGNLVILDDANFRSLIKLAIVKNNSGSSLADIQALIHLYFANEIFVFDNLNMQMSYLISSSVGSQDLVELFVTEGVLPKPMGVTLSSLVFIPSISLFGFTNYLFSYAAWNSGTNYMQGAQVFEDGIVYASLVNDNLNHDVSDVDFWLPIIFPFNTYDDYNTTWTWLSYDDTINIV